MFRWSFSGNAWSSASLWSTLYSIFGNLSHRFIIYWRRNTGFHNRWFIEFLQNENGRIFLSHFTISHASDETWNSFTSLIFLSVGSCNPGDSSFPTNAIQNWAHTKSDHLFVRWIIAVGRWWIVFKVTSNWTAYIPIECTEYNARLKSYFLALTLELLGSHGSGWLIGTILWKFFLNNQLQL